MRLVSTAELQTRRAPEEWFTGTVWMDAAPGGDANVFRVFFEPGARTNWHTHPEGQILYVLSGTGLAQKEGEEVVEFKAGDVVYFAPDERHWHGAGPETFMVHLAVNPASASDGGTNWMESVTETQYTGER